MQKNTRGCRALAVAISLVLAVPFLAAAQSNDPLGRQIVNRIFAQLCARGILRAELCAPTPPPSPGRLIVDKVTVPAGSAAVFSVTASGTGTITGGGSGTTTDAVSREYMVAAGTYSVTEAALAGWMEVSNTCVDVVVGAGETKTCTITNHRLPRLTVTKIIINDDGGTATTTDFTLMIDGNSVASGSSNIVATGTRMVSEGAHSLYSSTIGGDCAADGSIALAIGDVKTCTVTNNDNPPPPPTFTVTVHKYIDGAHADVTNAENQLFPIESTWMAANLNNGATTTATSSLSASAYEVQTSPLASGANYTTRELTDGTSLGASCADGKPFALQGYTMGSTEAEAAGMAPDSDAPFLANITSDMHIIVWNMDCTPMLRVVKIVVNDNDGTATTSDFTLFIDGATTTSGVFATTTVGAHVISEINMSGYTATFGGACDQTGNVSLAAGDRKECTITNDDIPPAPPTTGTITVIKIVVNDDEGTATSSDSTIHLHTTGDPMADVSGSPQPGSAAGTAYSGIAPGTYHVEETGGPNGYTTTFGGACDSSGFITLAAGESKTCTVTNNDNPPPITGKLLITEVLYDLSATGQGSENENEWVEIYNGMNIAIDLNGYTLNDNNSTSTIATSSTMLASGKYLVVTGATTTAGFWSIPGDAVVVVLESGEIGNGLANGGDRIFLKGPTGIDVDALSWEDDTAAFSPSVTAALDGYSILRTSPTTDTDTNADWMQTISPTPGL